MAGSFPALYNHTRVPQALGVGSQDNLAGLARGLDQDLTQTELQELQAIVSYSPDYIYCNETNNRNWWRQVLEPAGKFNLM